MVLLELVVYKSGDESVSRAKRERERRECDKPSAQRANEETGDEHLFIEVQGEDYGRANRERKCTDEQLLHCHWFRAV